MDIATWVLAQASEDTGLSEDAKFMVLAAIGGDDDLDELLDTRTPPSATADAELGESEPAYAFLKSITVEGFRGIGPRASLSLKPVPGLTVVAGRNGSGKSSLAEALELALTGDSYRGAKRAALWSETWRNLAQSHPCQILVELVAERVGVTTVGVDWPVEAGIKDRSVWVQRAGKKREPGLTSLGWQRALELYRPLLSYDELSGMLDGPPSGLFDAFESFLGLEQLTDASKRLAGRIKQLTEPKRTAKARADELKPLLAGLTDARAVAALTELKKRHPDTSAVTHLVTGASSGRDPLLELLAAVAALDIPAETDALTLANALNQADTDYLEAVTSAATAADTRAELLAIALSHHEEHGDMPCPVCGGGRLDSAWAERAQNEVSASRAQAAKLANARKARIAARRAARSFLRPAPVQLGQPTLDLPALNETQAAWAQFASAPEEDAELAKHLTTTVAPLASALGQLTSQAAAAVAEREDAWAALAVPLASWVEAAEAAEARAERLQVAEAAAAWLKANTAQLRQSRLEPLADMARKIWGQLRQESNVDLGSIRLEGANTSRRVDLRGSVDGDDAGALAVMSQGELHALALALFIPRAASDASPFRFVVLDDPIQAMDPSKVDGFVKVLATLAADRQVIVFSHDDRLPEAVRRMAVPARILEISRSVGSQITIKSSLNPAERYLSDARAVARDDGLSRDDKARVVPGLCRLALEAACRDVFYTKRLTSGERRDEVETAWEQSPTTSPRLALALGKDQAGVTSWLAKEGYRKAGLGICTSAVHGGLTGDPVTAVEHVDHLVHDVATTS